MSPEHSTNRRDTDVQALIEKYLEYQSSSCAADQTVAAHRSRLRLFRRWFNQESELDQLRDIEPRHIHEFQVWRSQGIRKDGVSAHTVRSALLTTRQFLRWCGTIDAVEQQLHERITVPDAPHSARPDMLESQRAEKLLDYLDRFYYASAQHVIIRLLWRTGMRAGALTALDLDDFDATDQVIEIRHRPDTGTPLKNRENGERIVAIDQETVNVVEDWIDHERPDFVDEYGREPLVPSKAGRRDSRNLRQLIYNWTRPCHHSQCPLGREIAECDAANWRNAHQCPETVSSHPIRRGAVTHHVRSDVPVQVVSDRVDCSVPTLRSHYSKVSEKERTEIRRGYLDNI